MVSLDPVAISLIPDGSVYFFRAGFTMDAMKIYTRTGDTGQTGLIGGARTSKTDPRMIACGEVDELNAVLGWAAVAAGAEIAPLLAAAQSDLFVIGAELATPADKTPGIAPLDDSAAQRLEREIDAAQERLPPLRNFILPGGSESSARLHLARAVCRRAERSVVNLHGRHPVSPAILQYLNRLSDWLFTLARLANHLAAVADVPWNA